MSIGERLKKVRKKNGISQDELARSIGVSRGVITNIEYNKIEEPQTIIVDALSKALNVNRQWLLTGKGEMNDDCEALKSAKVIAELHSIVKDFTEEEQLYLLDVTKALKQRLAKGT